MIEIKNDRFLHENSRFRLETFVIFDQNQRASLLKSPFLEKPTSFNIVNFDKKCPIVFGQKKYIFE